MADTTPEPLPVVHRFIDEVGDTTFFGKGKTDILGTEGVSLTFGMGIVKIDRPLGEVRAEIIALQQQVENDPLLNTLPSVAKRTGRGGFFFHACKDTPDVRSVFLHYLRSLPCEAEVVMARKIPSLFVHKHHGKDDEFYADVLSHLIKLRLKSPRRMVLNIAERGSSTRAKVLDEALAKALAELASVGVRANSAAKSSSTSRLPPANHCSRSPTTFAGLCSGSSRKAKRVSTITSARKSASSSISTTPPTTPTTATTTTTNATR